jgi:hypothetical protein
MCIHPSFAKANEEFDRGRIVHLTTEKDEALMKPQWGYTEVLREFFAIYVERDLRIKLSRREVPVAAKGSLR